MSKPVVAKKRPTTTTSYTSELRISVGEQSLHYTPAAGMFSPMHASGDSDCESEASSCYSKHNRRTPRRGCFPMNPDRLERVAEFVSQLTSPPPSATGASAALAAHRGGPPVAGGPLPPPSQLRRVLVYTDSMGSEFRATTDHEVRSAIMSTYSHENSKSLKS